MFYFIIRPREGSDIKDLCIVKAKSAEQAKKMVGVSSDHIEFACCPAETIAPLVDMKEGYFVKQL